MAYLRLVDKIWNTNLPYNSQLELTIFLGTYTVNF